jgi:hypothetical protein
MLDGIQDKRIWRIILQNILIHNIILQFDNRIYKPKHPQLFYQEQQPQSLWEGVLELSQKGTYVHLLYLG